LFLPATALVKKETSRKRQKGKNMQLEEVNTRTKEAVDFLVAALESGHSEVLTAYLGGMPKFHTDSFGSIMQKETAWALMRSRTLLALGPLLRLCYRVPRTVLVQVFT
jgi:hypothetical protein